MGRIWIILWALVGCVAEEEPGPPNLTEPLLSGEVRAGIVTDESSLFGGVSAEAEVGDFKIYNDRVQFIIQSAREGAYYIPQGGHVIDADIVRVDGQPGRDLVEEWVGMYGLGRLMMAETVEVIHDGFDGEPAIVRAAGPESSLELLEASLGVPGFIPNLGLTFSTDFVLPPDSWLMEVTTTITATLNEVTLQPGDTIIGSQDVGHSWAPQVGLDTSSTPATLWTGFLGHQNEVAVAILAPKNQTVDPAGLELLSSTLNNSSGFQPAVTILQGGSVSFTRYYGVGPDFATLSDAQLLANEIETEAITGTVTAPDGPVAGARVNISVDDVLYTMAFTDTDGTYEALIPAGSEHTILATGRGRGFYNSLPPGAGYYSSLNPVPAGELALESLVHGAPVIPCAQGRGVAESSNPTVLLEPAQLTIQSEDNNPFEVRVQFIEADTAQDVRYVRERPQGYVVAGWTHNGVVSMPIEPGTYSVLVHRGARFEYVEETLTLVPGEETTLSVNLAPGFTHDGWLFGDPHSHGALSTDAHISMEDRLLTMAGTGVQVHFGTDHDNVGDYRGILDALELSDVMQTIVASEISPVLRGHINAYPITPDLQSPTLGALRWWDAWVENTAELFSLIRGHYGEEIVLQSNHPLSGAGLLGAANWSIGHIGKPDYWSPDFNAVEVMNNGSWEANTNMYFDLVSRGMDITPVGVTDSHTHFGGKPGLHGTFFYADSNAPSDFTNDVLQDVMFYKQTIPSSGVFLDMSILPGSTIVGPATLEVEALSSSWVHVNRLTLYENGVEVETIEDTIGSFSLEPDSDAHYVVIATGDSAMSPVYSGRTPWALSSALFVDIDGDGWDSPLPPLVVETD